jgi:high-affinity Fe2+/Pb2+ permease
MKCAAVLARDTTNTASTPLTGPAGAAVGFLAGLALLRVLLDRPFSKSSALTSCWLLLLVLLLLIAVAASRASREQGADSTVDDPVVCCRVDLQAASQ